MCEGIILGVPRGMGNHHYDKVLMYFLCDVKCFHGDFGWIFVRDETTGKICVPFENTRSSQHKW